MTDSRKHGQMASSIQRELQAALARGLSDPRIRGLVTITAVEVLEDLTEARINVSVMPDEHAELTLHGLRAAAGHLRRKVGDRVRTRSLPKFVFRLDDKFKKQAGVLDAIARARADDERLSESSPTLESPEPAPAAEPDTQQDGQRGEKP